jgi:hypothetical protein
MAAGAAYLMAHSNESTDVLAFIQRLRQLISPGVSKWSAGDPNQNLEWWLGTTEEGLRDDGTMSATRAANARDTLRRELERHYFNAPFGHFDRIDDSGISGGQLNQMLNSIEGVYQDVVDEEESEL